MAFVCTARRREYHADVFRDGDSHAITVPVGYDDYEDKNYFVMIGLDFLVGGAPRELEYYFCIIEVDGLNKTDRRIWSGRDLRDDISAEDRAMILCIILAATEALLNTVKPSRVFRCTRDADLPERALEKHYEVSQIFTKCGYAVQTADHYHGKRTWWMERKSD
jgi:hypothetical protein